MRWWQNTRVLSLLTPDRRALSLSEAISFAELFWLDSQRSWQIRELHRSPQTQHTSFPTRMSE
eukprot:UN13407